jgi:hypothetical protein
LRSRFRLGAFEFGETGNRRPRRDARQSFAHEQCVGTHSVFSQHVSQMAIVRIEALAIRLEMHPSVQHELGQLLTRGARKRRRGVEPAPDLRRVNSQQAYSPDRDDVDRVAVDDSPHQHEIRTPRRRRRGGRDERGAENCQHTTG